MWPSLTTLLQQLFQETRCFACTAPCMSRAVRANLPGARDPARDAPFCAECAAMLAPRIKGHCPLCGELAAWPDLPPAACSRCLREPPPWSGLFFHGEYSGMLRELLLRLKFSGNLSAGLAVGRLLAGHPGLENTAFDCVTPVPLHPKRLCERGYNQAQELARPLAARLALPLAPQLLARIAPSRPQTGLDREARTLNVRGAFSARPETAGRRILLVDDVLTTGATLKAAARALLVQGAVSVSVAVAARTPTGSTMPDLPSPSRII